MALCNYVFEEFEVNNLLQQAFLTETALISNDELGRSVACARPCFYYLQKLLVSRNHVYDEKETQ